MLRWCFLSPDSPRVSAEYDGRSADRSFRLPLGSTSVKRLRPVSNNVSLLAINQDRYSRLLKAITLKRSFSCPWASTLHSPRRLLLRYPTAHRHGSCSWNAVVGRVLRTCPAPGQFCHSSAARHVAPNYSDEDFSLLRRLCSRLSTVER